MKKRKKSKNLARFKAISLAFASAYFSLLLTNQDALLSFSFLLWHNEELAVWVVQVALEQPGQQLPIEHLVTDGKHLFECFPGPLNPSACGFVDKIKQHAALGSVFCLNVGHQMDQTSQKRSMGKKGVVEEGQRGHLSLRHLRQCKVFQNF